MRQRPLPLRYTIPAVILGGGILIVTAATLHQFSTTARRGVEQLREHALFVGTTVAAEIEADWRAGRGTVPAATVHRLASDRRLRLAALVGPDDTVLASTAFHLERQPLPPPLARALETARAAGPAPRREGVAHDRSAGILTAAVPVELLTSAAEPPGVAWLLLRFDTATDTRIAFRDAIGRAAVLLGIIAVGSLLLLAYFREFVTRRVEKLIAATDAIAARREVGTHHITGGDELAALSAAIQRMAERLQAGERQLAQSEREFRQLIERGGDFIVTLDFDGRIDFVSPIAEQVLGRPADQLRGLPLLGMMPPEEADKLQEVFSRINAAGGTSEPVDVRLKAGEAWRTLEVVATCPPDWRGTGRLLLNARDVTHRVALEMELRQAQKMEALGQLAGGVAHDFNNLLTGILGGSELLLADPSLPHSLRDDVAEIRRCADQAAQVTRQLLAFSRRDLPRPRPVDVNAVVEEAGRLLGRVLGERVSLETRLAHRPVGVLADPSHLQQVIMNLAVNARDAMPDGGVVRLEVAAVGEAEAIPEEVVARGPGPWVRLSVEDHGTGIPPEILEHIYEPFFTTKAEGKGTGLGLATVWGIVHQLGGVVRVASRPGRTRFDAWLPEDPGFVPGEAAEPGPEPRRTEGPADATILLVEDDPSVRRTTRRILELDGYNVLVAESGEEALELLAGNGAPVNLLISDLVMPGMGGAGLMRKLADGRPAPPVLFVSGYDAGAADRGEIPPEAEFLPKPFTVEGLREKVRELVARGR